MIPGKNSSRSPESHFLDEVIDLAKKRLRIAILYSGDHHVPGAVTHATYNPRHWKSYKNVAGDIRDTLHDSGFRHVSILPDDLHIIDQFEKIDLAWLNTGGMQGRNAMAHAASILEMAGIPYIGHNPLNYALLDHKLQFKRHLLGLGLPTPDFVVWDPAVHLDNSPLFLESFRQSLRGKGSPWVVKPVNGRGSRFIHVVGSEKDLLDVIGKVYAETFNGVMVEEYMGGREFCVAGGTKIIRQENTYKLLDDPMIFGFLEKLVPGNQRIFASLDKCPIDEHRAKILSPETDQTVIDKLSLLCREVCVSLSLKYLIRLDVREDLEGQIKILEANPKPDLKRPQDHQASLVAMGLKGIDMDYADLLLSLLASGLHHAIKFRPAAVPGLMRLLREHGLDNQGKHMVAGG